MLDMIHKLFLYLKCNDTYVPQRRLRKLQDIGCITVAGLDSETLQLQSCKPEIDLLLEID